MSENTTVDKNEFLTQVKDANFAFNVAVERNINVHRMKEQLQNVLWNYRNEIANLADEVEAYKKQVADLNAMLDAVTAMGAAGAETASTDPVAEEPTSKKKAR